MEIKQLLENRVLVERINPPTTLQGIYLPESVRDDLNTGGVKLYRVIAVGPGKRHPKTGALMPMECVPGDRVFCHSYTQGPTPINDTQSIITQDQIIAVLPHHEQPTS